MVRKKSGISLDLQPLVPGEIEVLQILVKIPERGVN